MLTKRIIPCLDVDKGRVVKGVNFVDLIDAGDPVEIAKAYNKSLADEIVFLDITASSEKRDTIIDIVKETAKQIFIPLTVGGGIRTVEDFRKILLAGADKVAINSAAIQNPKLINEASEIFGSQCVVVAIDAKYNKKNKRYEVYTHGGRKNVGVDVVEWAIEAQKRGAGEILLTSMDKDGTKAGFEIQLTKKVSECVNIPVIASGGAGKKEDFVEVVKEGKADAVLAASLFHYKELEIYEVKEYMQQKDIPVRL